MFRDTKSQLHFYRVAMSDCETMVLSSSFEEAAATGLTNMLDKFKKDTNISFAVIVDKIQEESFETEVFSTCTILDNIGYFSLSKKISSLSEFLLDKSKKSS